MNVKLYQNAKRTKRINNKILTIDGASATGKSTISAIIAKELGWKLLESGAIYRAVAYFIKSHKLITKIDNIGNNELNAADIKLENNKVLLNKEDITQLIKNEEIAKLASIISNKKNIRSLLLSKQRSFATKDGLVAEGRDMGSRIFPDAKYKFFLITDGKIKTKRRAQQLHISNGFDKIYRDLILRDSRDINNTLSAKNSIIIDNSDLSIREVVKKILNHVLQDRR